MALQELSTANIRTEDRISDKLARPLSSEGSQRYHNGPSLHADGGQPFRD
jgi:hypothetical protein